MIASLLACDVRLFHLINAVWTSRFLDLVLPAVTDLNKSRWILFGALPVGLGFWIWRRRREAVKILSALALTVGAADLLAYRLVKPLARRLRPEFSGIPVIMRAGAHGRYGFPSNHAANCFAGAVFLGSIYPAGRAPLLAVAAIVAYSRVYVGAHFPLDVAGGAMLGSLVGWAGAEAFEKVIHKSPRRTIVDKSQRSPKSDGGRFP